MQKKMSINLYSSGSIYLASWLMVYGLSVLVQRENSRLLSLRQVPPPSEYANVLYPSARWRFLQQGFKLPDCSVTARL